MLVDKAASPQLIYWELCVGLVIEYVYVKANQIFEALRIATIFKHKTCQINPTAN